MLIESIETRFAHEMVIDRGRLTGVVYTGDGHFSIQGRAQGREAQDYFLAVQKFLNERAPCPCCGVYKDNMQFLMEGLEYAKNRREEFRKAPSSEGVS